MLTQKQVEDLGNKYLKELKSRGRRFNPIKFELKSRKSSTVFGTAYGSYNTKGYDRITINKHLTNLEELKNTMLHELAHLDMEGRENGHGPKWKKVARLYGQWYNTNITRTSDKELKVPGMVKLHVVWTDECLALNKHLPRKITREYTSIKYAENFVRKYKRIGFVDSYEIVRSNI